jgi:circadian clock protein KaiC
MRGEASESVGPAEAEEEAGYCLKRLTTGNRELDDILGGGFLENSINVLMGEPGSGKTILAEEFIFANAAAGDGDEQRPILYLTTLSEPLDKVIKYLQQFQFFDAARMGSTIVYESIGIELAKEGVAALLPRIKDAIKTMSPRILVIDSFKAIHDLATSTQEMRLILYEVGGLLTAYDTTVLLVGEYRHEDIDRYPEFAVADGIVELARNALGTRDERYLRVLKLRGSSYRQGTHAFDITAAGLQVYPRLVSPLAAASYNAALTRVPSGIPGLDPMLAGGLWAGSSTLLAGPTGSGKTTAGIQFIVEGLRLGERCLLVNFQENPTQLARQIEGIGGKLDDRTRPRLDLLYYSAVELAIDRIVVSIFQMLSRKGIRRVVIDALGDLAIAAPDSTRMHNYLYALVQHFAVMGVTSLLTLETDPPIMASDETHGRLSHMADNIIFLGIEVRDRVVGRTLRIAKARNVAHDLQARKVQIDSQGLRVIQDGK